MSRPADPLPDLDPLPEQFPGQGRIVLAFSGGADSMCLAWRLSRCKLDRPVSCLHIDHGLDPDSGQRASQAVELAGGLGLACRIEKVTVQSSGSPEAAARSARYAALFASLDPGETLLTAHHADDQAETVLLRLLRGSGPHGLAGIENIRQQQGRWLLRPLLNWNRATIQQALKNAGLDWIDDPANQLDHFDRNFLRRTILPSLRSRWPGADQAILRSARLSRGAAEEIDKLVADDLRAAQCAEETLDLDYLLGLSGYRQGQILQAWCLANGLSPPPGRRLDSFLEQLDPLSPDRQPELRWQDGCLRAWNHKLWMSDPEPPGPYQLDWNPAQSLTLPAGLGRLTLDGPPPGHLSENLRVCSGTTGERLKLPRREHHCRVAQLMQQAGVPPWERQNWPRIYHEDRLLAVGDRWLDEAFALKLANRQQQLQWHRVNCSDEQKNPRN